MYINNVGKTSDSDRVTDEFADINSCGNHKVSGGDYFINRPGGRRDYEIIYIWKGKGSFEFNGVTRYVCEGEIVVYKPNDPQIYTYFAADMTETYWIHFTGHEIEKLLREGGLLDEQVHMVGQNIEFIELIKKIAREINLGQCYHHLYCRSYLLQIISDLSRRIAQQKDQSAKFKLEKLSVAIEEMHNNYGDGRSIIEYSKMCHLSVSRFTHLFTEFTGLSPHNYRQNIQLDKAKSMLENTTLSIKEISRLIGIPDPLYFSRIFKKSTGTSPKDYRSLNQR